MKISEKQIMLLIQGCQEYFTLMLTLNLQSEGYRNKIEKLVKTIFEQQSEELKVIE